MLEWLFNNNALNNKDMSESMREGLITLIYKGKGNREDIKNWRPISLLNTDYKIISKILAGRVKKCLDKIININQTCGSNRDIQNNILSIQTIIEHIEISGNTCAMALIDQKKAFDRLEQNYLHKTLETFGFGTNFCNWTKILYSNINSVVQVNGARTDQFDISRSVRQGCPLCYYK